MNDNEAKESMVFMAKMIAVALIALVGMFLAFHYSHGSTTYTFATPQSVTVSSYIGTVHNGTSSTLCTTLPNTASADVSGIVDASQGIFLTFTVTPSTTDGVVFGLSRDNLTYYSWRHVYFILRSGTLYYGHGYGSGSSAGERSIVSVGSGETATVVYKWIGLTEHIDVNGQVWDWTTDKTPAQVIANEGSGLYATIGGCNHGDDPTSGNYSDVKISSDGLDIGNPPEFHALPVLTYPPNVAPSTITVSSSSIWNGYAASGTVLYVGIVPDFDYWRVNLTNPTSTVSAIGVRYWRDTGATSSATSTAWVDETPYTISTSTDPIRVHKSHTLYTSSEAFMHILDGSGVAWYAEPYAVVDGAKEYGATSHFTASFMAEKQLQSGIDPVSGYPVKYALTSSTLKSGVQDQIDSGAHGSTILPPRLPGHLTEDCSQYASSSWLGSTLGAWAGNISLDAIMCYSRNFVNGIGTAGENYASSSLVTVIDLAKQTFPASVFVHLNDDINAAASSTTSTDIIFASDKPEVFGGRAMPILTSSTTSWIERAGFDYKTWIDYIAWAVAGLVMIESSIIVVKRFRSNSITQQ